MESYNKELDLFINEEISSDQLKSFIEEDISLKNAINSILVNGFLYEDILIKEKLYFAYIISQASIPNVKSYWIYMLYLLCRNIISSPKLDWDLLLKRITEKCQITEQDKKLGLNNYNEHKLNGFWPC